MAERIDLPDPDPDEPWTVTLKLKPEEEEEEPSPFWEAMESADFWDGVFADEDDDEL